jgi:chemotaxis protein methyltransferase CheR
LATDIDAEALETAQKGIYGAAGLAKLPKGVKEAYFDLQDGQYAVKRKILRGVHYRQLDLLNDEYPKNCDLILCRNVLIYFTDEARERIYAKLSASLKEGGVLFVGSTEQVFSSGRYDLKGVHGFFYIKSGPRPAIHSIAEECAIK